MVQPGDLNSDGAGGGRRVARGEDVLLPETVPLGGRQDAHGGGTGLLQGVMTPGGDGEPAHSAQRLPGNNRYKLVTDRKSVV